MLGRDVVTEFARRGWTVASPGHTDLDVVFRPHLEALAQGGYGQYDWVVNCAAYTAVDRAEEEFMAATLLNGVAPGSLGFACHQNGWRFLHVGTDFVFDGEAGPYEEGALPNPVQAYGRTKLMGEDHAFQFCPDAVVARTSWLYGAHGKSFPRTLVEAARAGKALRVVADQTGTPTSTVDLARTLADLVAASAPGGVYHTAGPEPMTWHALAVRAIRADRRAQGLTDEPSVEPITTADWPTPARRPRDSALVSTKLGALGVAPMRPVDESLDEFVARLSAVPPATGGLA